MVACKAWLGGARLRVAVLGKGEPRGKRERLFGRRALRDFCDLLIVRGRGWFVVMVMMTMRMTVRFLKGSWGLWKVEVGFIGELTGGFLRRQRVGR